MNILRIEGTTRVLGQSQGYLGLPVRDVIMRDTETGQFHPMIESAWEPTPDELRALNEGKPVIVRILGTQQPPIALYVDKPSSQTRVKHEWEVSDAGKGHRRCRLCKVTYMEALALGETDFCCE